MSYLTDRPIDVARLLAEVRPGDGGVALFLGVVRDNDSGHRVDRILYEAYVEMAETTMSALAEELRIAHPEARIAMVHRTGLLAIGEASVAVVASSPHRAEAFAACRAAIDRIKETVPVWKKEFGPDGETWVQGCAHPVPPGI